MEGTELDGNLLRSPTEPCLAEIEESEEGES